MTKETYIKINSPITIHSIDGSEQLNPAEQTLYTIEEAHTRAPWMIRSRNIKFDDNEKDRIEGLEEVEIIKSPSAKRELFGEGGKRSKRSKSKRKSKRSKRSKSKRSKSKRSKSKRSKSKRSKSKRSKRKSKR